jgi:hypothetical protein
MGMDIRGSEVTAFPPILDMVTMEALFIGEVITGLTGKKQSRLNGLFPSIPNQPTAT